MHILIIHQAFASFDEPGERGTTSLRLAGRVGIRCTVIASPVSYITGGAQRPAGKAETEIGVITIFRAPCLRGPSQIFPASHPGLLLFHALVLLDRPGRKECRRSYGARRRRSFRVQRPGLLARLKGARFLFEVRDLWPQFAIAVGVLRNPLLIRATEWLESFLYRRADRLVVNSPAYIDHVTPPGGGAWILCPMAPTRPCSTLRARESEFSR